MREMIADRAVLNRVQGGLSQPTLAVSVLVAPRRASMGTPRNRVQTRANHRDQRMKRDQERGQKLPSGSRHWRRKTLKLWRRGRSDRVYRWSIIAGKTSSNQPLSA